jgi:hypothetical protein
MIEQATSNKPNKSRAGNWFSADKTCLKRPASEPIRILESFDRHTLAKNGDGLGARMRRCVDGKSETQITPLYCEANCYMRIQRQSRSQELDKVSNCCG